MTYTQPGDLAQRGVEIANDATAFETANGLDLRLSGAARAHEIRVIRVGEAVCAGFRSAHDCSFLESERGVTRPCDGKCIRNDFSTLGVGDDVPAPLLDGKPCDLREQLCSIPRRRPDLQVRRPRPRERPRPEQGSSEVRATAAALRDDPLRRPVDGCEPRRHDARLVQHLQRAVLALDVQLVPRLLAKSPPLVRADLGLHP